MPRKKFQIVLAETAGFCMGVRRAVRMVLSASEEPQRPTPIKTCGPLIHNRQVLQVLASRGIDTIAGPEETVGTAVVRAHGLTREAEEDLRGRCRDLLDATCPHVSRVQKIVRGYSGRGYLCIVVGDVGHAEVDGVLSHAGAAGRVVSGPEEVAALPDADKVAVVAQTTQDEEVFRRTVAAVRRRYGECKAFDTICRSTQERQGAVRRLAASVAAMIVVGGFDSANTRRLVEISSATGTPTFHVETDRDLDVDEILQYERVGLSAGASTPNWLTRKVMKRLEDAHRKRTSPAAQWCRLLLRRLVNANVYAAGAAAALTFACAQLLPGPVGPLGLCVAVTFLFVLGQHLFNQYGRRESLYLAEPDRAEFFLANERTLLLVAIGSGVLALFLSVRLGWGPFGLVVLGSLGGLLYRYRPPRVVSARLGFSGLERLPGSKELFVALAWATLAALVPALAARTGGRGPEWHATAVVFAAAFLLTFTRTLALDLVDVARDQIVGRETLAGFVGPGAAGRLLYGAAGLTVAALAGGGLAGWTSSFWLPALGAVPYGLGCLALLRRRRRSEGEVGNALVDGQFLLLGLAALLWGRWCL